MAIKMRGKIIRGRQERLTQAHHSEGLLARVTIPVIQRVEAGVLATNDVAIISSACPKTAMSLLSRKIFLEFSEHQVGFHHS
jgi:hypothetical protein